MDNQSWKYSFFSKQEAYEYACYEYRMCMTILGVKFGLSVLFLLLGWLGGAFVFWLVGTIFALFHGEKLGVPRKIISGEIEVEIITPVSDSQAKQPLQGS